LKYSNIADCHNHSNNSPDGVNTVHEMAVAAETLGLRYYTLTDHCECNSFIEDGYIKSYKNAYREMSEERLKISKGMTYLAGIELGQATQNTDVAEKVISSFDYDFVIGSLHNLKQNKDFYFWSWSEFDVEKETENALNRYFDELEELTSWNKFDSLAHITYPLRYIPGGKDYDINKISDRCRTIFKMLINNGKALEINTSGLRQNMGTTLPGPKLLRIYKELGGELITIGSDAHNTQDLGSGISEGMNILEDCGFKYYTVYIKRKPTMVKIS
jgi:histidinol-phosphatase (PHP family)